MIIGFIGKKMNSAQEMESYLYGITHKSDNIKFC